MILISILLIVGFFWSSKTIATSQEETVSSPALPHTYAALLEALPERVIFPHSDAYTRYKSSYWSVQETELKPACVISPTNTKEIALVIKLLSTDRDVQFAIRGGGHAPFAGSASIADGIVIDVRAIKDIVVNSKQEVVSVGAGAIWGDVYSKLDELKLSVVGGRGSTIGVGGLTTGGGISYFSPRKGFACDNVVNYEVVLADGRIINANSKVHPDLWIALKGGSNNFGIVTRFDLLAFHQGDFWGGMIIWDDSTSLQLLSAFADLNVVDYDEYAALILSFSFVSSMGFIASGNIQYTKPETEPPTFIPFTSIKHQYANTMKISNNTDFVTQFVEHQGKGRRQLYITNTFQSSLPFLIEIYTHFKATLSPYATIPTLQASLTVQPITPSMVAKATSLGGNSLGLENKNQALVLCLCSFTWGTASDDATITALGKSLDTWIVDKAKEAGLWNEWVYLNYAASWQHPINGYGAASKAKLEAVSKKYDPHGMFQKQVPGGFKLFI